MTRSHVLSANDRLKGRFGDVVALSFIAATLAHFLVFQMWPEMTASDWTSPDSPDLTIIDLPTIALPAPPAPFSRPAVPVISDNVDATATIEVVDFRRMKDLPPPPPRPTEATPAERRPFVVFDVPPRLTNPEEFQRALMRAYPRSLRDAGVGGTVTLEVYVDEQGRALEGRVSDGSGYDSLDETAVSLIDVMRFAPALNRDRRVAVWVQLPIAFRMRSER